MGIRARTRDRQLLCRSADRDRVLRFRVQRPEQPTGPKTERGLLLGSKDL
jgi:hypothetical protein